MPDPRNFTVHKRAKERPVNEPLTSTNAFRDVTGAQSDSQEQENVMSDEAKILFPPRQVKFSC